MKVEESKVVRKVQLFTTILISLEHTRKLSFSVVVLFPYSSIPSTIWGSECDSGPWIGLPRCLQRGSLPRDYNNNRKSAGGKY